MDLEYEKYKTDKLVDYFKFISSAHLAVIGVVVTFKEKFLKGPEVDLYFWITIALLFVSFIVATYGYITLINSYFEQIKHHLKIAKIARKWPGYILIASITSFAIQAGFG
ncbi:hypothetical protein [Marinomonas balearica]|uniref:Uncharacterized protein n=1 Tax=Marinomonas balearica TaxID=491947 RepID=A0A4V3CFW1_9GAMM|nr:hypothetical protein [Marinomonas balearica]TDO95362.1 hypothetical protein DFP79_3603 [Marinomonas balearica]